MSKRKIMLLAATLMMVAVLAIGGTLAYFTDTDNAVNVFTVGNVNIRQDEWQRNEEDNSKIEVFEDNKNVFPAVYKNLTPKENVTVDGYDFTIRSQKGNYVDKIVNVTNEGTEEAYIRTIFAIPSMNGYDDGANTPENPLHWNYLDASDFNGIGWDWNGSNDAEVTEQKEYVQAVVINGVEYDLYVATHIQPVAAGKTTSPSMVGFYLDDSVDYENGYYSVYNGKCIDLSKWMKPGADGKVTLQILVATQACQTAGFADAWDALDECFGEITTTNHPWYNPNEGKF